MSNKYGFRTASEPRRCVACRKKFEAANPRRKFCSDKCRVANWMRFNKDKVAVIQKRCRMNQKAEFAVEE